MEHDYKGMKAPPKVATEAGVDLHRVLRGVPSDCVDLLDKMLTFLPEDRLSWTKHYNTHLQGLPEENWKGTARPASSSLETAVGPAMSRIEDDDAWERVAQLADRDMSNVLGASSARPGGAAGRAPGPRGLSPSAGRGCPTAAPESAASKALVAAAAAAVGVG